MLFFGSKQKKKSTPLNTTIKKQSFAPRQKSAHPFWGCICLMVGLLALVSLIDYNPLHNSWITTAMGQGRSGSHLVGKFGEALSFWLIRFFGFSAWVVPFIGFWSSYLFFIKRERKVHWKKVAMGILAFAALTGLFDIMQIHWIGYPSNYYTSGLGGLLGNLLYTTLTYEHLGIFGSSTLFIMLFAIGLIAEMVSSEKIASILDSLKAYLHSWKEARATLAQEKKLSELDSSSLNEKEGHAIEKNLKNSINTEAPASYFAKLKAKIKETALPFPQHNHQAQNLNSTKAQASEKPCPIAEPFINPNSTLASNKKAKTDSDSKLKIVAQEKEEKVSIKLPQKKGNYIFPSTSLLSESAQKQERPQEDYQATAQALVRTLEEFNIKVFPGEVHTGPVITRYEVTPAAGVRVEKISSLDRNIAMGLKATSVRILAPVPGKGCVGIEVPNQIPTPVCLREIIESKSWVDSKAEIPIVLGKDVTGKPLVADLTRMPHLLIAGSTGAGKTVCINAIIASLVYHSSPQDIRFIMVDPKIVEMQVYNDLPHMLIPVVTAPKKVPGALKWLISEMERRYHIFAQVGVRNIAGFNARLLKNKDEQKKAEQLDAELSAEERVAVANIEVPRDADIGIPKEKMPYIVCIIDELADLMMVAPADIETCIARLAQLARAAGIHLIIATQRPSVNVITGVIKANLPCRIAFKVASKVDSRTILDYSGADALIGRGDMLFTPPGSSDLIRAQGAFVSDEEINSIVEYLKRNGAPDYAEDVQMQVEMSDEDEEGSLNGGSGPGAEWGDELIPAALDVLRTTKRASTSMLQRRLRIGYNRAARIMEILEDQDIVGPENGSQPREILKNLDDVIAGRMK